MPDLKETIKDLIGMEGNSPMSSRTEACDDFHAIQTEKMRSRMQLLRRVLMNMDLHHSQLRQEFFVWVMKNVW